MSLRKRYLDNADTEVTHSVYYGALVELLGESALRSALPLARGTSRTPDEWAALIEDDKHMNNVPLRQWDAADNIVRLLVMRSDKEKRLAITGSNGWSLSDSVCVLKETARRYASSTTVVI